MQYSLVVITRLDQPVITDLHIIPKKIIEERENKRLKLLTPVVAVAGYGKSVTISEWLDYKK